EPYPHAENLWWSFGSRSGVTADGIPYFVGGVTDLQGGSTVNRGLFYGLDAAPRLMGGDSLGGVDDPVDTGGSNISFDYRLSALGTHYIAEVTTDSPSASDGHMVIDGTVIQIDGQNVTEGSPVPAAAGGLPGENWKAFDSTGVTEDDVYMFTGDTDAATDIDEFICINGVIVHREGDVIDGWTVGGTISYAYLNGDGDYAYVWKVETDEGLKEALFFNDQLMLMVGDLVDMDGDGEPEPDSIISDFTGIAALAMGDRDDGGVVNMYFTADVEIPGAPRALSNAADEDMIAAAAAPAEFGYEEDLPVQRDNRAEIEAGFVMPSGTVVAVEDHDGAGDEVDVPQLATRLLGAHPNPF
ncbi:MAG: hypothetical protein KAI25_16380, partial [Hyphomicrobiaceae bacterium]|nr:hypothetical protein [Hyphomicrobiaceae bacterium]